MITTDLICFGLSIGILGETLMLKVCSFIARETSFNSQLKSFFEYYLS